MYRLAGVIPLIIGVFVICYSYLLSLGSLTQPGPGLWPFVVGVVILLSSIALLVVERDGEDYERFTSRTRLVGLGLISLGLFVLLIEWTGFTISSLLLLAFWLRFLGKESWRSTIGISVLSTAGFHLLFIELLGVPFPEITFS